MLSANQGGSTRAEELSVVVLLLMWALIGSFSNAQSQPSGADADQVRLFIPYQDYSQEENEAILEMYAGLRVADVSDGMDVVGLADVGLVDPSIQALWRDSEDFSHRIIGIAVTARYVPTNRREAQMTEENISRWYRELTSEAFIDMLFPGSVLVIDGSKDNDSRTIGSSNIQSWMKRGAVGVVTSGGVGDTDEIVSQKNPVYYRRLGRGIRPGRNQLESVNRPINLGGALVRPGDVVVADGDGVIIVPREHARAVAKAARPFLDNIGLERHKKTSQTPGQE